MPDVKLPALSWDEHHLGFRGSVHMGDVRIAHAVSKRDHHKTVCGREIYSKWDEVHMNTNGAMVVPTCLWCWTMKDPFP